MVKPGQAAAIVTTPAFKTITIGRRGVAGIHRRINGVQLSDGIGLAFKDVLQLVVG